MNVFGGDPIGKGPIGVDVVAALGEVVEVETSVDDAATVDVDGAAVGSSVEPPPHAARNAIPVTTNSLASFSKTPPYFV